MKVAVVIPYYQASSGILQRALCSIMQQCSDEHKCLYVLVVDDGSPVPAEQEISKIAFPDWIQLRVIRQLNAGPGAARNLGLDNVPASCDFVAFLDSDDEWSPHHLTQALAALSAGADFYFADHWQKGQQISAFTRTNRIDLSQHPGVPGHPSLHFYSGDMFSQIMMGNIIGTSTVVYRFKKYGALRFNSEFRYAGEDYLFWMFVAQEGARFAFSIDCGARYGKGINIYSGSGWGSDSHLLRIYDEMRYRIGTGRLFKVTEVQRVFLKEEIKRLRLSFARDLLHRILRGRSVPRGILRNQFKLDKGTFLSLPFNILRVVFSKC